MLQLLSFAAQELEEPPDRLPGLLFTVPPLSWWRGLRFNKLPYVSICSSTGESELTFQSVGCFAFRMQRPKISTSVPFITLNDWMTEWRPSVIALRHPRAAFHSLHHLFSPCLPYVFHDKLTPSWNSPPSVAPSAQAGKAGTCPFQS